MLYRLTVGAIIRCAKSVVESGFIKIVATQPVDQTSSHCRWTILAAECDENGNVKSDKYFQVAQEEIDRWQSS